jgi:ketosteroid isomerase-like protein
MKPLALAIALLALIGGPLHAQQAGEAADHEALRKLKSEVISAINTKNLDRIDALLHKPFLATVVTQDSFNDAGKLKAYFEGLFTRRFLRIAKLTMDSDADEPAEIITGTFAVARGGTKERYEMADGRSFTLDGRWTATALKDAGQWKVLTIHSGVNFIDNPVINAIERTTMWFAGGGFALGAVIGILIGWFFTRRRRAQPA